MPGRRRRGDQHDRFPVADDRGAAGLAGPTTRFDGQVPSGYFNFVHVSHSDGFPSRSGSPWGPQIVLAEIPGAVPGLLAKAERLQKGLVPHRFHRLQVIQQTPPLPDQL